jgi:hypothetical protein
MTKQEYTKILRAIYTALKKDIPFKYALRLAFADAHVIEFRVWKEDFYKSISDRQALNLFKRAEHE